MYTFQNQHTEQKANNDNSTPVVRSTSSTAPVQCHYGNNLSSQAPAAALPSELKTGLEQLSGFDMSDVRVNYSSPEPSRFGAAAFAQGTNIHLAPGQQKHLPHEAWHVVQQKQGRVPATRQFKGQTLNTDAILEREADVMGTKALAMPNQHAFHTNFLARESRFAPLTKSASCVQLKLATFEEVNDNISLDVNNQRRLNLADEMKASATATFVTGKSRDSGLGSEVTSDNIDRRNLWKHTGMNPFTKKNNFEPLSEDELTFRSSITWRSRAMASGSISNKNEGYEMSADPLGPDHKMGSEPGKGDGKDWVIRRKLLSTVNGSNKYIAGHLLNADLGGPGNASENLAAIPGIANSQHKKIEQRVKSDVNREGKWGHYKVALAKANFMHFGNTVEYASNLRADWIPYGIKTTPTNITTLDNSNITIDVVDMSFSGKPNLVPINSKAIYMNFAMPAPSIKGAKAGISPTSPFALTDSNVSGVQTFIKPEEIILTSDTSLIVHSVAEKIRTLLKTRALNETQIEQREEDVWILTEALSNLEQIIDEKADEIDDTARLLNIIDESNDRLVEESKRLRRQRNFYQDESERLRDERDYAETEWDHYYRRSQRLRDEIDNERDENLRLKRNQAGMEREIQRLRAQNYNLERENQRLRYQRDNRRTSGRSQRPIRGSYSSRPNHSPYTTSRIRRRSWQDD